MESQIKEWAEFYSNDPNIQDAFKAGCEKVLNDIMFSLRLKDSKGDVLNFNDIVKLTNGNDLVFYVRITRHKESNKIIPFDTFSYHNVEKVKEVPNNAVYSNQHGFDIWFLKTSEKTEMESKSEFESYLSSWRLFENLRKKGIYEITPLNSLK